MKKTILYSQRVEYIESYGERRDCADQRIAEFIYECGFVPFALPNNPMMVRTMVNEIKPSGIVLTGGNSLTKYGGNSPERDETDALLIKYAQENIIPLYGFCRGMQSILDYFGCKLVDVDNHVAIRHNVRCDNGSFTVNSYHNQACVELANDELMVKAISEDGVIEMVQHKKLPIVGTMWHPERENPFDEKDKKRLKELIAAGGIE